MQCFAYSVLIIFVFYLFVEFVDQKSVSKAQDNKGKIMFNGAPLKFQPKKATTGPRPRKGGRNNRSNDGKRRERRREGGSNR